MDALVGLDLTIRAGEFIALLGPSGCGKSTALNCLAGLLPLTHGAASGWTGGGSTRCRRRSAGSAWCSRTTRCSRTCRCAATSRSACRCAGCRGPRSTRGAPTRRSRLVQLEEHADKLPGQLSGGQQQRVAIARAVVLEPSLVLMDEPLSNLDAKLRLEMRTEIRRLHQSLGLTTVYVTHDQEEALSLADRLVVLRDGRVQQVGTPEELHDPPGELARRRLHGLPQPAASCDRRRRRPAGDGGGRAARDGGDGVRLRHARSAPLAAGDRGASPRSARRTSAGRRRAGRATGGRRTGSPATVESSSTRAGSSPSRCTTGAARRCTCAPTGGPAAAATRSRSPSTAERLLVLPGWTPGGARRPAADWWSGRCDQGDGAMTARPSERSARAPRDRGLRHRLAERGVDRRCCCSCPAVLFVVAAVRLPVLLRARAVVPAAGARAGRVSPTTPPSSRDAYQRDTIWITLGSRCRRRCSTCWPRCRSPTGCAGGSAASGCSPSLLVVPITLGTVLTAQGLLNFLGPAGWFNRVAAGARPGRRAGAAGEQLLGRVLLAGHHRLPVRVPADPVLPVGHRPDPGAGGGDARRRLVAAVPADHPAAAGARPGHHVLPDVRARVQRVPVGGPGRRPGRARPGCIVARRLPGRVRAVRLLAGLGHRDGDGRGRAAGHRRPCWPGGRCSTAGTTGGKG